METTPMFFGDENGLRDGSPSRLDGRSKRHSTAIFDPEFGRKIKASRALANVTQEEFALMAGIHPITLSRIETATWRVTARMRATIEEALSRLA